MPPAAKDPLLGRTIAQRYRLISRLGAGSAASVYLARHVLIERLSAIKIVHPELARDAMWRERFLREARAVNRINHPNIAEINDLGEADGLLFLVMEYVPGESLQRVLERGPLGWRRAAQVGVQAAEALGRANQMGVVHRSLDVSNILLVPQRDGSDVVKITDFGVAKLSDAAPLTLRVPHVEGVVNLHDLDARSDLFDLGAVLYHATTGRPAPHGGLASDLDPALASVAPRYFVDVLTTLLSPDPDQRPRDGFEAADMLARAIDRGASFPAASEGGHRASWRALVAMGSSPPPSGRPPASAAPGGGLGAAGELAERCSERLASIEEGLARRTDLEPLLVEDIEEARRLVTTAAVLAELVASDRAVIESISTRGHEARADLGRALDAHAREQSRALGWAGTIAERSYQVEAQRLSGGHPVQAVEVMVWEQAALEEEEDRARERAAVLQDEMHACRRAIEAHHERHDHELRVATACAEGRLAALRSVAAEASSVLDALEARVAPLEASTEARYERSE